MITVKDYVYTRMPSEKTKLKFARDTVISEKELDKLYVNVCGEEIPFIEWIKSIIAMG